MRDKTRQRMADLRKARKSRKAALAIQRRNALVDGSKGKIINLREVLEAMAESLALKVNQDRRRDADHARIMVVCVRAFLREILRGVQSAELPQRGWLSAVERVLKLAEINLGKKATKELGIDWNQALPLVEIGASSHSAAIRLREKRLPQWAAKMRRR
jgi:hypothetical protein